MEFPVEILLFGVGAVLLLAAVAVAARRSRRGRLRSVDLPGAEGPLLRSERWRLAGRPDEIRERSDGTLIPVEVKSRAAPRSGPSPSHVAQVAAYCLLLEEQTGRPPPFGVLRYGDGQERRIPWDDATRRWVVQLRERLDQPYDGRANPGVARCRRCPYRAACDRRAA
jgi:CRISPR-associated exonuclease Cas4